MGKPVSQGLGEINVMIDRCNNLCDMSREALQDDIVQIDSTNMIKIKKEPIGISFIISPWNYPLITTINSLIASILCGNPVILKHSVRTPIVGDFFAEAFKAVGPNDVVQHLFLDGKDIPSIYSHKKINYVGFTGSVDTGKTVLKNLANSQRFIHSVFELGGKDPAYVRADADLEAAVAGVVDGAMYNAGQSCCSLERVYVHESLYDKFVDLAVEEASKITLGNPLGNLSDGSNVVYPNMGPMALPDSIMQIKDQVDKAGEAGADILLGGNISTDEEGLGRFFKPTILANCDNTMDIMQSETFGPVLPISKVYSDNEAIEKMNDSQFGLTAAVYSKDYSEAEKICSQLNSGTVFLNRCDSLHPRLPWSGRKESGIGIGLSKYAFGAFYRTKGYNFNLPK
eukprot:CAMPEP_0170519420 /NCGR_PEP_ID=MMETSP0209-20121228/4843_1 /TAXON_ID=665100 ORGANISM="Litonotus pictus, Strain P1" /NCGR_SAMPLE_ID=MMETSP0209 /ASSEMBLY_ACC=CAM_ASM_000301 /LENGTH=398 /DNA_ID=CAMNT_0010805301 /DNA_START=273 /DNA_END=1469 /DNA_ORIENTATION=+